jgi:polyisoprenoid-binding protein YceI
VRFNQIDLSYRIRSRFHANFSLAWFVLIPQLEKEPAAMNTATVIQNQVAPLSVPSQAATFDIDPSHSSATFKIRHLMVTNVRGELGKVSGHVVIDEQDLTRSSVEATIDATAINTRDEKRDAHLRSPDFFDTQTYPTITFKSTRVQANKDGSLRVTGDLTMRGVTKPATLEVEPLSSEVRDPWGNTKRGATATAKLNRKDWNISWNAALDGGGLVVGDEVSVTIEIELGRRA